jgi:ABC-2 type transport system permease protein
MKAFFSMVIRELKAVRKEKTILFAIIIQLFIASFSSVIVVGLMAFYDPSSIGQNPYTTVKVGVIGDKQSPLINFLQARNLLVVEFDKPEEAEAAFKAGQIHTIIYIPKAESGVVEMKLVLPDMDAQATVVLMVLKQPLQQYEDYLRKANGVQMLYTDIRGRPFTTYEFLYSVIIPILMFFPAFVAGSMVIDTVCEEIENKTLDTLRSTPVSLNQIFGAKIVASVMLAVIQCLIWAILLRFNRFYIQNLGLVLLFAIIVAVIIAIIAVLISMGFRDRERSQFIFAMVLLITVGLGFFLNPSPFSLVARLATGDHYIGAGQLIIYLIPMILLCIAFPFLSRKLVFRGS